MTLVLSVLWSCLLLLEKLSRAASVTFSRGMPIYLVLNLTKGLKPDGF